MQFRLFIDEKADELVTAQVRKRSKLIDEIEMLCLNDGGIDSVTGYTEDETQKLSFDEIECVTVLDSKIFAVKHKGEKFRLKLRLYEVESILPTQFVKINKSSIANENCIQKFRATFGGSIEVIFKCGYKDFLSRRCYQKLKGRFEL